MHRQSKHSSFNKGEQTWRRELRREFGGCLVNPPVNPPAPASLKDHYKPALRFECDFDRFIG